MPEGFFAPYRLIDIFLELNITDAGLLPKIGRLEA
jgi:hypothetical protein